MENKQSKPVKVEQPTIGIFPSDGRGVCDGFEKVEQGKEAEEIAADKILDFYYEPKMHWKTVNRRNVLTAMEEYKSQSLDKAIEENKGCNVCGGKMVFIRGKYPKQDKREICPTCAYELLEQVNEISSPAYGKTYQNIKQ